MTTQTDSPTRTAVIRGGDADTVANYLPANYRVDRETPDGVLIVGSDNAGWTLDGYILPRLASGLMFGTEVVARPDCITCGTALTGDDPVVTTLGPRCRRHF